MVINPLSLLCSIVFLQSIYNLKNVFNKNQTIDKILKKYL